MAFFKGTQDLESKIEIIDLTQDSSDEDDVISLHTLSDMSETSSDVPLFRRQRRDRSTPRTEQASGSESPFQIDGTKLVVQPQPPKTVPPKRPQRKSLRKANTVARPGARKYRSPNGIYVNAAKKKKPIRPSVDTSSGGPAANASQADGIARRSYFESTAMSVASTAAPGLVSFKPGQQGKESFEFQHIYGKKEDIYFDFAELPSPAKSRWIQPCSHRWRFPRGYSPDLDDAEELQNCVKSILERLRFVFRFGHWDEVVEDGRVIEPPTVTFPVLRNGQKFVEVKFHSEAQHKAARTAHLFYKTFRLEYWQSSAFVRRNHLTLQFGFPADMEVPKEVSKQHCIRLANQVAREYKPWLKILQLWQLPNGYPTGALREDRVGQQSDSQSSAESVEDDNDLTRSKHRFILLMEYRNSQAQAECEADELTLPGWLEYFDPNEPQDYRIKIYKHGRPDLCDYCKTSNTPSRPRHLNKNCVWTHCLDCLKRGHKVGWDECPYHQNSCQYRFATFGRVISQKS